MLLNPRLASRALSLVAVSVPWLCSASDSTTAAAWQHLHARSAQVLARLTVERQELPSAPQGVVELSFREFFGPVGEGGLEYTNRIRELAGKRVRLVGHMVREGTRRPGVFLLSPIPASANSADTCFAGDVPITVVHVHLPVETGGVVPFQPGRLAVTGVLEIGQKPELTGGNSAVRLHLEKEPFSMASQKERQ